MADNNQVVSTTIKTIETSKDKTTGLFPEDGVYNMITDPTPAAPVMVRPSSTDVAGDGGTDPLGDNYFRSQFQKRAEQAEQDKIAEENRLKGERLARGVTDLSSIIGDMIRASEGAPVLPRDVQKIYDNLTAQEQANLNNYRIRMQKLHDDARAEKARQDALRAAAAKDQADKAFAAGENAKNRAKDLYLGLLSKEARTAAATIAANARKSQQTGKKSTGAKANVRAFGKTYIIPASQYNATLVTLGGILEDADITLGLKQSFLGQDKESEIRARVESFLQNLKLNPDGSATYKVSSTYAPDGYEISDAGTTDKNATKTIGKDVVDIIQNYISTIANSVNDDVAAEEEYNEDEVEDRLGK